MARLTLRLSGTEKQRDDALEALVLQQEIAEDLERERKRNQKELTKVHLRVESLGQQRDEARRVVLHLRSLIHGQSHHMEHVLRSIGSSTEISDFLGFDETTEEADGGATDREAAESVKALADRRGSKDSSSSSKTPKEAPVPENSNSNPMDPEFEDHLLSLGRAQKRLARLSITDVADRYLRDKTDAIADIVRNISEQCAAAVEGLQLAQDAEVDGTEHASNQYQQGAKNPNPVGSHTKEQSLNENEGNNSLHPDPRHSSVPPTPELVHNRSSTSMSMGSTSTYQERLSTQYAPGDIPTRIVEDDDEPQQDNEEISVGDGSETTTLSKPASQDYIRSNSARIVS